MIKISVIIPVYNGEAFLEQSIRSVTDQTCQNLEILVVDDGSADRSPEICKKLGLQDHRILFYPGSHRGVSAARNLALDIARGEYVFFLDSDDRIHPLLLEEMLCRMEEHKAGLGFCAYEKAESGLLEKLTEEISKEDERPLWRVTEGAETEERFHMKNSDFMQGIGGKMIRRDLIGSLRFDTSLRMGEDTWFLYHLISGQVRAVFSFEKWYYYRMHEDSVTHLPDTLRGESCFDRLSVKTRIRDQESGRKDSPYALKWEEKVLKGFEKTFFRLRELKDSKGCRRIKELADAERKNPLYSRIGWKDRLLFWSCFHCRLLFRAERKYFRFYDKWIKLKRTDAKTGILTFHCSDNFGAMLQAYGLKTFLGANGIRADVIRYEPPYMTGRHWLLPYVPGQWKKGIRKGVWYILRKLKNNLRMRELFFARRRNMRLFRENCLTDKKCPRLLSDRRLKRLPYQYFIVGSDQIWNPDITCGLRKAYFGAFGNRNKERVISYGASLGGTSLPARDEEMFSRLLGYVDAVSLREEEAVPYVRKFCGRQVEAVLDPVFLLKKKDWSRLEKPPKRTGDKGYILVYVTEKNRELRDYIRNLSREKGLETVEVSVAGLREGSGNPVDFTAGPSEFLGYIRHAEYVVSNSFHAVAFSIIYEKRFLAFAHSGLNARISNILKIHGLEDRLCGTGNDADIDGAVDWERVRRRTREAVVRSGAFLIRNVPV